VVAKKASTSSRPAVRHRWCARCWRWQQQQQEFITGAASARDTSHRYNLSTAAKCVIRNMQLTWREREEGGRGGVLACSLLSRRFPEGARARRRSTASGVGSREIKGAVPHFSPSPLLRRRTEGSRRKGGKYGRAGERTLLSAGPFFCSRLFFPVLRSRGSPVPSPCPCRPERV